MTKDISHSIYYLITKIKLDLKKSIGLQINGHRGIIITYDLSIKEIMKT